MKAKHIRIQLKKKVEEWLESIDDLELRLYLGDKVIITGGAIVSLLLDEKVHDYDIYFRTKEAALRVANYYVLKFTQNPPPRFKSGVPVNIKVIPENDRVKIYIKSAGIAGEKGDESKYQYFEGAPNTDDAIEYVSRVAADLEADHKEKSATKYRPVFLSSNAITLSDQIQLIVRFFGEPSDIHENFDFVHCTNYWTSWENQIVLEPAALESILARELRYIGSKYPICSVLRIRKFLKRGWYINAGQTLKILMQVSDLKLDSVETLEEQLTGVDAAYFHQIINLLRAKVENGETIDRAYLFEVIDKIF